MAGMVISEIISATPVIFMRLVLTQFAWFAGSLLVRYILRTKKRSFGMEPVNRREFLAIAAALPPLMQANQASPTNRIGTKSMFVRMHEASSARYDFKTAMEGYAKAGIRGVEPDLAKVREFAMKESPMKARQLLDDLGLKAVSSSNQLGLMEPSEQRGANLEQLKWKVELAQAIGADRLVTPSAGTGNYKEDD